MKLSIFIAATSAALALASPLHIRACAQPTTTAKPTSTTTKASTPTATGSNSPIADTIINAHNVHRSNHSAPALTWDAKLASSAQQLADTCVFQHNTAIDGGGYGQNLAAAGTSADASQADPRTYANSAVHDQWYNGEMPNYTAYGKEPDLNRLGDWGHFTQVVWKGTSRVGCAVKYCPKGTIYASFNTWYTVCNYGGPGNYVGQFAANVLPPRGAPVVHA